jgi:large subunit ribosomal protein L6
MSYIGKKLIRIPENIQIQVESGFLNIKGPLGFRRLKVPVGLQCVLNGNLLSILEYSASSSALWGTFRSVVRQTVQGLSKGFSITLVLEGIGYNAFLKKDKLLLKLGFSKLICLKVSSTINVFLPKRNKLILLGSSLQEVSQFASKIRSYRFPNPYKVKGVLYKGETYLLKEGKKK